MLTSTAPVKTIAVEPYEASSSNIKSGNTKDYIRCDCKLLDGEFTRCVKADKLILRLAMGPQVNLVGGGNNNIILFLGQCQDMQRA